MFLDFVSERYKVPPHRYIFDEKILTHSERYDIDASVALLAAAENHKYQKKIMDTPKDEADGNDND